MEYPSAHLQIGLVICLINFVVFVFVAAAIGGDAINGYEEQGRYFLRAHGRATEVSRSVFIYSKWHALSAMIGTPLMCVIFAWTSFSKKSN
jgi:hypothetical protein